MDTLHHVKDHQTTMDELWRVVKPGGRIVIEEPDIRTLPVKVIAFVEKITMMRSHYISPQKIQNSFHSSNASTHIESEGAIFWVIIDKLSR